MKKDIIELWSAIKEDPKDFAANVLMVVLLFGTFYCAIWVDAIISGRA